jgi:hypothetical protein
MLNYAPDGLSYGYANREAAPICIEVTETDRLLEMIAATRLRHAASRFEPERLSGLCAGS